MAVEKNGSDAPSAAAQRAHAPDTSAGVTLMGGHPVLDFANTVAWRTDPDRQVERVKGATAWARWAVAAGLLTAPQSAALQKASAEEEAEETERQLAALCRLRGLLWPVLDALTEGEPPPAEEWDGLRRVILLARESAELPAAFPLRWQPGTERLADLGHTLALQAEALLAGPGLERIRRCGGPGCGWFFLDRSRGGTRRWCSSGDCGNRDRARRHYARSKQAAR
ncbi:CGNR zinc finger domain-containing protein [Streptomyces sp. NPDC002122]|uniref:CGNR zinc finger domain-containing protein n=1 Tax=Streptomyces sp. NPDC002122 TaxID=3154407 RepID=UPI0033237411